MSTMQKARIVVAVIALAGAWFFHSLAASLSGATSDQGASAGFAVEADYPAKTSEDSRSNEARVMRSLMYLCAAGSVLILGQAAGKQGRSEANPSQDDTP